MTDKLVAFAKDGIDKALHQAAKQAVDNLLMEAALLPTRALRVTAQAPDVADAIISVHRTPAEALAHADEVCRTLEAAIKIIRGRILATMDGSFELDAYNGEFSISRVKLPVKYEYPSPEHTALVAKIAEYKAMLKDLEDGMRKAGQAVAQTDQEYTIKLTEKKLTMKTKEIK
jgi:hypothetical protein